MRGPTGVRGLRSLNLISQVGATSGALGVPVEAGLAHRATNGHSRK
jgi:hypothetical protein